MASGLQPELLLWMPSTVSFYLWHFYKGLFKRQVFENVLGPPVPLRIWGKLPSIQKNAQTHTVLCIISEGKWTPKVQVRNSQLRANPDWQSK